MKPASGSVPDPRESTLASALVDDLVPVTPLRLAREIGICVVAQVSAVLAAAWMLGVRPAAVERLGDPVFLVLLAVLAAGAVASVVTMASLAVPGRVVEALPRLVVVVLPVVLAFAVAVLSPWGGTWKGALAVLVEGFGCTRHTLVVAAPAWLAGLWMLRRLGSLDAFGTGLFASCAALLWSALAVQMACPSCDSWHLAMSHYLPIVVAAWGAAVLSVPVLRESGARAPRQASRP